MVKQWLFTREKKSAKLYVWSIIAYIRSLPPQVNNGKIWNKYEVIITKSYHLAIQTKNNKPFQFLSTLSSPADAVMMPELKSFTANATPEIHKEIQNYQTYICINMPSWWVCHNHTVSFIIKINHIFCNILIHYNTVWLNNNSGMSLPPLCCFYMDVL